MLTMTSKLGDNKIVETTIVGSEAVDVITVAPIKEGLGAKITIMKPRPLTETELLFQRQVRPRAWLRVSNISNEATGLFETQDVQLQSERLEPLYDQAALDAAVAAERERFLGLIERHNNDSFMASVLSDSVRLGMDAAGVKA